MKKIILMLLFLVCLNFVSAIDTEINIRTYPHARANILIIQDSDEYQLLEAINQDVPETGELAVIYSGEENDFKVNVQISYEGETLILEKFGVVSAGEPLYLQVIPGSVSDNFLEDEEIQAAEEKTEEGTAAEVAEEKTLIESPSETTEKLEEQQAEQAGSGVTGNVVSGNINGFSKTTYLVLAGIFIALAVFFIVAKTTFWKKDPAYDYKPIKPEMYEHKIEDAERKIKEVEDEIITIKNKKRLDDLEHKMAEEQRTLTNLRDEQSKQERQTTFDQKRSEEKSFY